MDELNVRVVQVLDDSGLGRKQLSEQLHVSLAQLSHISSGRNKPGVELIQKLIQLFPEYNAKWLVTGQGSPLESTDKHAELKQWLEHSEQKMRHLQLELKELELELKELRNEKL